MRFAKRTLPGLSHRSSVSLQLFTKRITPQSSRFTQLFSTSNVNSRLRCFQDSFLGLIEQTVRLLKRFNLLLTETVAILETHLHLDTIGLRVS